VAAPALGILELALVARGIVVADALLKKAVVELLRSRPVSGGKHLLLFRGEVAEVEESLAAGRAAAGAALIDELYLPAADDQLWPLLPEPVHAASWDGPGPLPESVAIVETATACAAVAAADAAVKAAEVTVRDLRLAIGISGKAFFTVTGTLSDFEAAAAAASATAGARLLGLEVIASPAPELLGRLFS
jgi:microcompartment protein CcmL/EutN